MEMIKLSHGNSKLKSKTEVIDGKKVTLEQFLIFSLPAEKTCPQSTEMCRKSCYAKKAERMYLNTRIARERNYKDSLSVNFVALMIGTIEFEMNRAEFKNTKFFFRLHESGDFYSVNYMMKWIEIANHFIGNDRIVFGAYTKSLNIYNKVKTDIPNNLIIRASIWNDTTDKDMEIIVKNNLPYFKTINKSAIKDIVKSEKLYKCIGDCSKCKTCYTQFKKVAVELH